MSEAGGGPWARAFRGPEQVALRADYGLLEFFFGFLECCRVWGFRAQVLGF